MNIGARRALYSLIALVIVLPSFQVPASATADAEKPTLLGLATQEWETEIPEFISEAGRAPAFRQVFWNLDLDWYAPGIQKVLDANHNWGITTYQMLHNGTLDITLDDFNSGVVDGSLADMVDMYKTWMGSDPTKRVVIAPFPEPNLISHPWSGDPAAYQEAFRKIHSAFRDAGLGPDQVRFAFVMNGLSSKGFGYAEFYPGDSYVDLLAFNKLNRNIVLSKDDPWRDYEVTFAMHITEMSETVSDTKPIFVNQTGSVDDDLGRRTQWIADMFAGLKAHPQVIGATYFNRDKLESGTYRDFRVLVDGQLDPTFKAGYDTWSGPSAAAWVFDGRMDAWVLERERQKAASSFNDVSPSHPFFSDIEWLLASGITKGCNPPDNDQYCPDNPVTRGQMAAFLVRLLNLPTSTTDYFGDDATSVFEDDHNRLAAAGITKGCNPPANDMFCPTDLITRGQMAAFLARALNLPAAEEDFFSDDAGSVFQGDINRLAAAGVTKGCNPPENTNYCPDSLVTRAQMAAFLHRADSIR